jgi:TIR domain
MPGVFISHSSLDKQFVSKLARDLAIQGFPVWFDSWELELGDSLYDRIFNGIDETTFLLIAFSPNALQSKWVTKELNAALAKEDRLGRKVILPMKVMPCDVPLSIADRLHVDFTKGYLLGLERLESLFRTHGIDKLPIPPEQRLFPLSFSKGLYLEQLGLQDQYGRIVPELKNGHRVSAKQFLLPYDQVFGEMRDLLRTTLETVQDREDYSPDLERELRTTHMQVKKFEEALPEGIAAIANGLLSIDDWAYFGDAAHWYARITRSEELYRLSRVWQFVNKSDPPLGKDAVGDVIDTRDNAARFWGVESVISCDLFKRDTGEHFRVWIDADSEAGVWFTETPQIPVPLTEFWAPHLMHHFIFPQVVAAHHYYYTSKAMVWDFEGWKIGRA